MRWISMTPVQQFEQLWKSSEVPPDVFGYLCEHNIAESDLWLGLLRIDQQYHWQTDQPLKVEDYLKKLSGLDTLPSGPAGIDWKLQLAIGEFDARRNTYRPLSADEISSRFPDLSDSLRERLRAQIPDDQVIANPGHSVADLLTTSIKSPNGKMSAVTYITGNAIGGHQKGRYRLDRVLGEGSFGRVYLGFDEELLRQVAIKVPTKARFQRREDADDYLAEARVVASLDHPNIVPVYDMGRTDDGSIYVVSKFIEGGTLEGRIKAGRFAEKDSAQLLATLALALQHAHQKRLIHRDIKPANILIEDKTQTPYVADFGLAIREEDYLEQNDIAGTPAYMSPEQIRGEGHRLDGRSDIFSMGVILYELLTGSKPFRGSSILETMHLVVTQEPRPPRELLDTIPSELERICLKTLSKRASDRYATVAEFADDLLQWLKPTSTVAQPKAAVQVVPRGLRSFDANDADFFLDLLPGPRNRDGLPESIAFWKQRIEQTDPEQTFSVGLIYGPSGCGKSSLVKAGLLPHLSNNVIAVYVEATPEDTETRILRGLRKRLPELSEDLGLTDTLASLRRGQDDLKKVVIIIDQFEQWLLVHRAEPEAELVKALRQCDGRRLQSIVMVRDDFAMGAARLMNALDVPILQGENFATVDLFEVEHAAKVLTRFGQAFGKLPANAGNLSAHERQFVNDVSRGLAQDGKIVSVRLSLFADMVKSKPWTAATLQQVGGTQGIGVNFLEETFGSRDANPRHRPHAVAARGVLRSLLPELHTDIKGGMRSHADLLAASGYQDRPADFNDLLRILDGELRLITPTDPDGDSLSGSSRDSSLVTRYYQLTHDYLVPSLREWLFRKQKETRKGRAELKLEERAALWTIKPENRHLPSLREWIGIQGLTETNKWTECQRNMMQKAGRIHMLWTGSIVAILLTASLTLQFILAGQKAASLVEALKTASPEQWTTLIQQADESHHLLDRLLQPLIEKANAADAAPADREAALPARLVLAGRDSSQMKPLSEALLSGDLASVEPIRTRLCQYASELRPQ
jgi:serine/threonine protein kinase